MRQKKSQILCKTLSKSSLKQKADQTLQPQFWLIALYFNCLLFAYVKIMYCIERGENFGLRIEPLWLP